MARFDAQVKTALRLIEKNGQVVTWRIVRDEPPVDSAQPWKPTNDATPVEKNVSICFLTVDRQTFESLSFMDNGEIPQGAVMGYMGKVDFVPSLKDVVVRDGKELRVYYIDELKPNGQTILYKMVFKE